MPSMKDEYGMGPGGECICSNCGYREPHQRGVPCFDRRCPNCNTNLMREEISRIEPIK